jgi:hypothetical protein
MSITIFTAGATELGKAPDGYDVFRIQFERSRTGTLQRHELPDGHRLETNGAVAESMGRGGPVLEIISLDELQSRSPDERLSPRATGSCTMAYDEQGLLTCASVSCTGSCVRKTFLGIFAYAAVSRS